MNKLDITLTDINNFKDELFKILAKKYKISQEIARNFINTPMIIDNLVQDTTPEMLAQDINEILEA